MKPKLRSGGFHLQSYEYHHGYMSAQAGTYGRCAAARRLGSTSHPTNSDQHMQCLALRRQHISVSVPSTDRHVSMSLGIYTMIVYVLQQARTEVTESCKPVVYSTMKMTTSRQEPVQQHARRLSSLTYRFLHCVAELSVRRTDFFARCADPSAQ